MSKKRKKPNLYKTKDYYPLTNPDSLEKDTNVSLPSEKDIEEAKNWVDDTGK